MAALSCGPARGRISFLRSSARQGRHVTLNATMALLLGGTALVHAGAVRAQTTDDSEAVVLDTISLQGASVMDEDNTIVAGYTATGSKTVNQVIDVPAQVSVVTKQELDTRAPSNLMQALSYTSSVSVGEYGSDSRYDWYRIRGFLQTNSTYRDGLPLRGFNFTSSIIEPYAVQRIEVLKGSTSTLFGLNAPGGLVNVITKRPQAEAFGEAYTTLGKDHVEAGVDFGAPLDADGVWTYRLTAKAQDSEVEKYRNNDRKYLAAALTWKPTDATSLTLLANYLDVDGNPGNSIPIGSTASRETFFGEPDFNKVDRIERSLGYEFSHDFGNGLSFRQNFRYASFDFNLEQVYIDTVVGDTVQRAAYSVDGNVKRTAIDNQLQYDTSIGSAQSRTLFGVEYVKDDLYEVVGYYSAASVDANNPVHCGLSCLTHTSDSINDMVQKSTGIYLQEELTLDDKWIFTLGGRHDRVETDNNNNAAANNTQSAWTKRLGVTYKATPDLAFYANYSESFNPVGAGYVPYMAVAPKPQEGRQYEVGAKYRPAGSDALISFALFDLSQTNTPRYATVDGVPAYWQIGRIDVKGAELEGRVALNDQLNLNFAYSYWDAEIINGDNPGNRPLLTPKHTASIWADYAFDQGQLQGLRVGGGVRLLGERFSDDANTARIGSSVVYDLMASYKIAENTEVALNVSNLFDRQYVASYNFDNTATFFGDGREVKVTLRHTW